VIERVSTGLLATRIDLQPLSREMLATADLASTTTLHAISACGIA
jgi:hypothetical protein